MKKIHWLALAIGLLLIGETAVGQTGGGIPHPIFHWTCTDGDSSLNFHPATTSPLAFDSIPYSRDYTMVVVYKPVADTEALVWNLVYADSAIRGLTTRSIVSDSTRILYAESGDGRPVIHTLCQSAPETAVPNVRLAVGDGNIKVAEVLYFSSRLGNAALRRVQSALAVRYGITLGPVDYIGGDGAHVWDHRRDSARFHHRITGVGVDSAYNLLQLRSHSEMEGGMVSVITDSLRNSSYLLFGDNDAPLDFVQSTDGTTSLSRQWGIQATGMRDETFTLVFDIRDLPLPTDSLALLVEGEIFFPTATTFDEIRFDGVWLPSDTSVFTLVRGITPMRFAQSCGKGEDMGESTTTTRFNVFPNPTTGRFNVEVSGARQVQITIHDLNGKVMDTYKDSDRSRYRFEGVLPSGNFYYVTVVTENGSQTTRLVVK